MARNAGAPAKVIGRHGDGVNIVKRQCVGMKGVMPAPIDHIKIEIVVEIAIGAGSDGQKGLGTKHLPLHGASLACSGATND